MGDLGGFDEFVRLVFDHDDPDWMWGDHEAWMLEDDPSNVVDCFTRVFEDPALVYPRFTSEQVGTGVNFLIEPSMSNIAFCLMDSSVPLEDRLRALRSIESLYRKFFAAVLPNDPSIRSSKSRASYISFMFWDVFPFFGRTVTMRDDPDVVARRDEHFAMERTCIDVIEETLAIDHFACQESALHGLGHWSHTHRARVSKIVDKWLAQVEKNHPLREYAERARIGMVQ
jgi:hypothetical protein